MEEYLDTENGFASSATCVSESCEIRKIVNLYFKAWFLTEEVIAEKLTGLNLTWTRNGKFFVRVTPQNHHEVRRLLEHLCLENGSILFDSEMDFVDPVPA
ncbi:hypothetical protein JI735_33660 (plasmid) [Paenibacillus sonchi]|uniref:Uncharacterized protein n=1 Tax=Paenibacillus sonchi TaxID=373687 RepID=A0A974SGG2_9BACL|nr:hypothetical protein [Paenibacillus sonchi]QQZ64599.1 hypothetical protein JI735_33660 [Paenibacillus sonchi]